MFVSQDKINKSRDLPSCALSIEIHMSITSPRTKLL